MNLSVYLPSWFLNLKIEGDCGDISDEYRESDRTCCEFRVSIVKEKS